MLGFTDIHLYTQARVNTASFLIKILFTLVKRSRRIQNLVLSPTWNYTDKYFYSIRLEYLYLNSTNLSESTQNNILVHKRCRTVEKALRNKILNYKNP